MAVGTKTLKPADLNTYENEKLVDELKKAKEELFNLRFQSSATSPASTPSFASVSSEFVRHRLLRSSPRKPLQRRSRLKKPSRRPSNGC